MVLWGAIVGIVNAGDPAQDSSGRVAQLKAAMEKLRPLQKKLPKPQPTDWLAEHPEAGQTFAEYLLENPITPRGKRNTIYVQPLGEFSETQRRIMTLTSEFIEFYFNMPVKTQKDFPLSMIPGSARRVHPEWGVPQILTGYVLDDILKPRLPEDAIAYIALTPSDLWPGEGWNFVFGQASLRERVGVWSFSRFGDPDKDEASFRLCLRRTLRTATHEIGHVFGIRHCVKYECNMCGSNHMAEADRHPLYLCCECMAKVCWATGADPVEHCKKLAAFCEKQGLQREAEPYRQFLGALGAGGD